jgi:hypothetical protein
VETLSFDEKLAEILGFLLKKIGEYEFSAKILAKKTISKC